MSFIRSDIRARHVAAAAMVAVALIICGCAAPPVADKSARAIKPEEVLGTWGGFSDDSVFCLLKLQEGGSGFFGYIHRGGQPAVLRIKNWQCLDKRLLVLFEPTGENPDGIIRIEGPAGWTSLNLTVSSPNGGKRKVLFHREDVRVEMRNALEARMATEVMGNDHSSKN